jgi:ubiquitin thioesterase protein OTUB1
MSRPSVLASAFHPYGQNHHYAGAAHHSAPAQLTYRQPQPPLSMRPPELASGYNTGLHLHTGHHHGRINMSGPQYMASDDELAQLQKLSNEYEPEATVSLDFFPFVSLPPSPHARD